MSIIPRAKVFSPYREVDWDNESLFGFSLHNHSHVGTSNWGSNITAFSNFAVLDALQLDSRETSGSFSGNRTPAWPWQDAGRDPAVVGLYNVPGCEFTRFSADKTPFHHTNLLWSFVDDFNSYQSEHEAFAELQEENGLAFFAHPNPYDHEYTWYVPYFDAYPNILGLEVINRTRYGDGYYVDFDFELWHDLCVHYGKERPVLGCAGMDSFGPSLRDQPRDRAYNVIVAPSIPTAHPDTDKTDPAHETAFKDAMTVGKSFWVINQGEGNPQSISAVTFEPNKIHVSVSGSYTQIRWMNGSTELATGDYFDINQAYESGIKYVRFEVWDGDTSSEDRNIVGSQPMYIEANPTVKKTLFSFST
jgi:hypothetical protein